MSLKSRTIFLAFALLKLSSVHAQQTPPFRENPAYKPALGGVIGTTGIGLTLYQPLGIQFGLEVGAGLMPYNMQIVGTYGDYLTHSTARARLHNAHLMFGWVPFHGTENGFRHLTIQLGAGYLFKADGTLTTQLRDPQSYGDIELQPEEIGTMYTTINWKEGLAPYVGLGFSDMRIDEHFGFNIALGGYLLSQPSVSVKGTAMLEGNEINQPIIERNLQNYRYLPNLQLGIAYSFNAY